MMYGFRCNESSFSELLRPFGYNLLTKLEALVNNPLCPERLAGLHGAHANFVIAADNRHLIASLRLRNRTLRQQQSALFHAGFDAHTSILAGAQDVAGIGKRSNDANGARAGIHLPVRQQDFAFLRVDTPVCKDQFDRGSIKTDRVIAGSSVALALCDEILMFVDREESLDGIDL